MATLKVTNIKNESFAGDQLYLKTDGKIGINQTSPQSLLSLGAGTDPIKLLLYDNANTNKYGFGIQNNELRTFYPDNSRLAIGTIAVSDGSTFSEKLRIDSSGRVLIGTITEGEVSADNLTIADSGHCGISIRSGTSSWASIFFSDATSGADEYIGAIEYKHNDNYLRFRTAATERLRIDSSGLIWIGGTTVPSGDTRFLNIISTASKESSISFSRSNSLGGSTCGQTIRLDTTGNLIFAVHNVGTKVTMKSDGNVEIVDNLKTNNLPGKNLIINGAFRIAQRGTSSSSDGIHTVDRFAMEYGGEDDMPTQTQHALTSSDTGPWEKGFRYSYHILNGNNTSAGSGDYIRITTRLEAQDIANSGWHYTSSSSYATLSFWVKSSVAQTFYGQVFSQDGSPKNFPFSTGALSANTWTKVEIPIPGASGVQFDNNNKQGMVIYWWPYGGANMTGSPTLNTWASYSSGNRIPDMTSTWWTTNDATFELTGIQLEVGSIATQCIPRPYHEELRLCQRYYQEIGTGNFGDYSLGTGYVYNNGNNLALGLYMSCPMRTTPTIAVTGNMNVRYPAGGSTQVDVNSPTIPTGMDERSHWLPVGWGITSDIGSNGDLASLNNSNNDGVTLNAEL